MNITDREAAVFVVCMVLAMITLTLGTRVALQGDLRAMLPWLVLALTLITLAVLG